MKKRTNCPHIRCDNWWAETMQCAIQSVCWYLSLTRRQMGLCTCTVSAHPWLRQSSYKPVSCCPRQMYTHIVHVRYKMPDKIISISLRELTLCYSEPKKKISQCRRTRDQTAQDRGVEWKKKLGLFLVSNDTYIFEIKMKFLIFLFVVFVTIKSNNADCCGKKDVAFKSFRPHPNRHTSNCLYYGAVYDDIEYKGIQIDPALYGQPQRCVLSSLCGDGKRHNEGFYCGKGRCNVVGCNCDGGCIEGDTLDSVRALDPGQIYHVEYI